MNRSVWLSSFAVVIVFCACVGVNAGVDRVPEVSGIGIWGGCGDVTAGTVSACGRTPDCSTGFFECLGTGSGCDSCPAVVPNVTTVGTKNITVTTPTCPAGTAQTCIKKSWQWTCHCQDTPYAIYCGTYTQNSASGTCVGS
jgi:hypothetical protein